MAIKFNPLTGNFDFTGSGGGGGGASYIDGEVQNFSALPTANPPAVDSAYLVREPEGTWLISRKPAGIYIRVATTGTRATDWTYAGILPDVFNDANFLLYDNADSSKNLAFQLSGITTGTTRTLTVPDASGTIALTTTAPASHTHGNLTNDGKIGTTANLPLKTGTNGVIEAGSFGTAAGSFCEGNDARLSDDRDPNAHAASHLAGTPAIAASYTGIGDNETFSDAVTITANTAGTAGNNITLSFDGVDDVDTALAAWNAANPSNQATLDSGDGGQVPDDGDSLQLSGGVAAIAGGSDPFANINQNLGTTDAVEFTQVEIYKTEDISGQDSALKALSTQDTTSTDANWRGRVMVGADNRTFLMGCYLGEAGLGAHSWTSAATEEGAAWADFLLNPDGPADLFIGCQSWDKDTAIVKISNSSSTVEIAAADDQTKRVSIDVTGVSEGETRTLEIPDASGVIALVDDIVAPPDASDATPQALGTAAAGTSAEFSRADHIHAMPSASDVGAAASGSITTSGLTQSTARILGRTTASTGSVEEIQIGSGLSLSAGELSSTVSAGIPATLLDAKGDLIVASAADTAARLAVGGTNGHVLTVDSAETLGVKWAAAAGGVGGGTGSTDNSILRSDGTGGSTLQASGLVIEDTVSPINITGDAGTDIITAVGHAYTANQGVRFPTLTGGAGLTAATTNYFVRDISGDTFKVSTTSGGAAVNFTTNITAGTVVAMQNNVALANAAPDTNSSLVLLNKGTGSFIVSPARPDGTATGGGNPRGDNAVCIVPSRSAATQVASGSNAVAIGRNAQAGGTDTVAIGNAFAGGNSSVSIGWGAGTVGQNFTVAIGRECTNNAAQSTAVGYASTANAVNSVALGGQISAGLRAQFATSAFNAVYWGGQTTNATPLILNLDATATNRFTIAASTALAVDILLVARRSDTQDKWLVARRFLGIRRDGSNNTSLIGSVQTLGTDQSDGSPSWTFALTADDTNEALQLEVTGAASETIQWRATAFYRVA